MDYKFIHSVASPICKSMTYVLHESLPDKPSLEDVFKGKQCVCILFRVLHHEEPTQIAHWTCLMKGKKGVMFFDSLGINLKGIYRLTHEPPKIAYALRNTKYEQSHHPLQKLLSRQKYCGCAVVVRLRYYKTHTNAQFEKLILDHNRQKPGLLLVTLCLFHYTDQHEYDGVSESV